MGRKLIVDTPDGQRPVLEQAPAADELQLQERLKAHPNLLPLEELGLVGPALVLGRESQLDSGRVDLVLLGNGGDLALVELKTGPQNSDFRACLAQLLDYGSDLWQLSLEEFEARVVVPYLTSRHAAHGAGAPKMTLDRLVAETWSRPIDDAVDWRERLTTQLRDGSFHYVVVAQRFTPSILRTLQYLNVTTKGARFSAVELVRFEGSNYAAFEARFVAGAEPSRGLGGQQQRSLSGLDEFLELVTDDDYRHALQDVLAAFAEIAGLSIYWGTTGCSMRVAMPGRSPLSIGWAFPPGPPRWMGLTDLTLGWYEDANGLALDDAARESLDAYRRSLEKLPGAISPKPAAIRGATFGPEAVIANADALVDAVRTATAVLTQA